MSSSYYARPNGNWRTSYQKMPEKWFKRLPEVEDLMAGAPGKWHTEKKGPTNPNTVYRHYDWNGKSPETFPKVLQEMIEYHNCMSISMFVGLHEGANSSLGWHVDSYEVWAFNIMGTTKWTWFEIDNGAGMQGQIREQIVEPGHMFFMPKGISHMVDVLSEERTSISIIAK